MIFFIIHHKCGCTYSEILECTFGYIILHTHWFCIRVGQVELGGVTCRVLCTWWLLGLAGTGWATSHPHCMDRLTKHCPHLVEGWFLARKAAWALSRCNDDYCMLINEWGWSKSRVCLLRWWTWAQFWSQKWRCGALNAHKCSSEKFLEFKGLLKQLIFRLIQAVVCALIIQSILREKQDMI